MKMVTGEEERVSDLLRTSESFLRYLAEWETDLAVLPLAQVVREAGGPGGVAIHVVDLTIGFCDTGRLASPRIAAIVFPVVDLLSRAHDAGVKHFLLIQDAHPADSPEFEEFGPHCVVGSPEAQTVPELEALPFSNRFLKIPKRSISPSIGTELESWMAAHPEVTRHIVVGDCTDICVYQTAMYLKMRANALMLEYEVLVPEDCVQTYDFSVERAQAIGAIPHDGDLLHLIALYHMALNGVRVVRTIT